MKNRKNNKLKLLFEKPDKVYYVSGKITGLDDYISSFANPTKVLRDKGHKVINPVELDHQLFPICIFAVLWLFFKIIRVDTSWLPYIIRDVIVMYQKRITKIAMLPNWNDSTGAKIERLIAVEKLGAKVELIKEV